LHSWITKLLKKLPLHSLPSEIKLKNSSDTALIIDSSHWKRHGDMARIITIDWQPKITKSENNLIRPFSEQVELRVRLLYQLATKPQCSSTLRTLSTNGTDSSMTSITYRTLRALLDRQSRQKIDTLCVGVESAFQSHCDFVSGTANMDIDSLNFPSEKTYLKRSYNSDLQREQVAASPRHTHQHVHWDEEWLQQTSLLSSLLLKSFQGSGAIWEFIPVLDCPPMSGEIYIGRDPSVSKSNLFIADFSRFFFTNSRYILYIPPKP
jgi:hypothetical protein